MDEDGELVDCELLIDSPTSDEERHHLAGAVSTGKDYDIFHCNNSKPGPSKDVSTCQNFLRENANRCNGSPNAGTYSMSAKESVGSCSRDLGAVLKEAETVGSNVAMDEVVDVGTALARLAANSVNRGDLPLQLQKLMLKVREVGCIVDAVQADVSRQNNLIIKLVNSLKDGEDDTAEQLQMAMRRPIPPERLLAFPFRVCNRHFNNVPVAAVPIVPNVYLPKRPEYSREELFIRLRRRYVFLSEMGFEDIDLDRLEPNGIATSPSDTPLSCCIPGCTYKSHDISLFSRRYVKMYSIPSISVEYGKWRKGIQNGLGIPSAFDFNLPEGGYICEMHFTEGKRYTRGVMQDPSVFRRLCTEGVSPSLARLGSLRFAPCSVKRCINRDQVTVCIPFPEPGDALHALWSNSLKKAGEKFVYTSDMVICLRHFSPFRQEGLVPSLFLGGESKTGTQTCSLKRKLDSIDEAAKRSRLVSEAGPEFVQSSKNVPESRADCCDETRRISETVDQINMKTEILERVVSKLNVTCKNYYDNNGDFDRYMKFQLYDILSELKAQKNIVHSLRTKLEDSLKDVEKKLRWSID